MSVNRKRFRATEDEGERHIWNDVGEYVSDKMNPGEGFQKRRVVLRRDRFGGCEGLRSPAHTWKQGYYVMCISDPIHCSTCTCNGCNRKNKEQSVMIPGKDAVALVGIKKARRWLERHYYLELATQGHGYNT